MSYPPTQDIAVITGAEMSESDTSPGGTVASRIPANARRQSRAAATANTENEAAPPENQTTQQNMDSSPKESSSPDSPPPHKFLPLLNAPAPAPAPAPDLNNLFFILEHIYDPKDQVPQHAYVRSVQTTKRAACEKLLDIYVAHPEAPKENIRKRGNRGEELPLGTSYAHEVLSTEEHRSLWIQEGVKEESQGGYAGLGQQLEDGTEDRPEAGLEEGPEDEPVEEQEDEPEEEPAEEPEENAGEERDESVGGVAIQAKGARLSGGSASLLDL